MLAEHQQPLKGVEANPDGRLNELFTPLIYAAPEAMRSRLIVTAKTMYREQKEVEYTSPEADVLRAFIEVHEETKAEKITTRQVAGRLNAAVRFSEHVSEITVGRILSKLGLRPTRTSNLRAYWWNEKLVEQLKRRYISEEAPDRTKDTPDEPPGPRLGDFTELVEGEPDSVTE